MILWRVLVQQQSKHHYMLWLSDCWKRRNVSRETPPCYDCATLLWLNQHACTISCYCEFHGQMESRKRHSESGCMAFGRSLKMGSAHTPGLPQKISVFSDPAPGKYYATIYEQVGSSAAQPLAKIFEAGILLWRPGVSCNTIKYNII